MRPSLRCACAAALLTGCASTPSAPLPPRLHPCPAEAVTEPVCAPTLAKKAKRELVDVLFREKALDIEKACLRKRVGAWDTGHDKCVKRAKQLSE